MISMLLFDQKEKEAVLLKEYAHTTFAYSSEENLNLTIALKDEHVEKFLKKNNLMDIAFMEVADDSSIEVTKEVRKHYDLSELLIIAEPSISPMKYMTPSIRAVSLLLRPFTKEQCEQTFLQFFKAFFRNQLEEKEEQKLVFENREGKIAIPYSKIYYLEVREKKVYVRLKEKEYSKYESLENISKDLPDNFMRCHRSFIVNTDYISKVKLSENLIYLDDDILVPLSRSYKSEMKEYIKGIQGK